MKKYLQPELTISLFDVEDVVTASGVQGQQGILTTGYNEAAKTYGGLFTDSALTNPATTDDNVVYFSWE